MTHREGYVSSPAQVPLAAPSKRDGKQHSMDYAHNNRDINEQDMLKSNIDQQVKLGAVGGSAAPSGRSTKARSRAAARIPAHRHYRRCPS